MWDCPDDFPVVDELRAEGATDYVALPLVFTDGTIHVATWSTRQPGGFTSQQLADLDSDHRAADAGRRNPRAAADRDESAQHLCRPPGRRTHPHGRDPARPRRGDPRRDLALRHARLHGAVGAAAAAGAGRSAQPLFRLPGAADPRAWRRGAEIHRRWTAGDFPAGGGRRRRRRASAAARSTCAREAQRADRGARQRRRPKARTTFASGSRSMSAR